MEKLTENSFQFYNINISFTKPRINKIAMTHSARNNVIYKYTTHNSVSKKLSTTNTTITGKYIPINMQ